MTAERWEPIPDSDSEISNHGNVRTVDHVTLRSNGASYTVKSRMRRISVHEQSGLRYVKLATGRRRRYRTIYVDKLVAQVFGDKVAAPSPCGPPANICPSPANPLARLANSDGGDQHHGDHPIDHQP
jgi:NUMOD4 motif